jgi:hypothetical protein
MARFTATKAQDRSHTYGVIADGALARFMLIPPGKAASLAERLEREPQHVANFQWRDDAANFTWEVPRGS